VLAWLLNLLLPGCGLILQRRDWLGFALAMLYGVCGNIALAGWLIAPDEIRPGVRAAAVGVCIFTWLLAQWLLHRHVGELAKATRTIAGLLREAQAALRDDDPAAARRALELALTLDPEHVELCVLRARLAEREGDAVVARRVWQQVLTLEVSSEYRAEANRALSRSDPGGAA